MREIKTILGALYPVAETIGKYIGQKISSAIDEVFPPEGDNGKSSVESINKSND